MGPGVGGGWSDGMRVVIHKNGMLEMSIINVIFLTNVEKCFRVVIYLLLIDEEEEDVYSQC